MFDKFLNKKNNGGNSPFPGGGRLAAALKINAANTSPQHATISIKRSHAKPKSRRSLFSRLFHRSKVNGKELAVFTRQLAATINAGLLLSEALETIGDEAENEFLRDIVAQVRRDIQAGQDFSGALARHPKVFPEEYVSIIRSGEAGGGLAKTLANLAKYLESTNA